MTCDFNHGLMKARGLDRCSERGDDLSNDHTESELVRLEVDMIETRRVTKIIEVSKETANNLVATLWGYKMHQAWSEEDCCAFIMRTEGLVTKEIVVLDCDTLDILEPNSRDMESERFPSSNCSENGMGEQ